MSQVDCQLNAMAVYAEGIDASNYVANVVPAIRQKIGYIGDLLDIGAGAGQLGSALSSPPSHWVAVEPDAYMGGRLSAYPHCTKIIASGWAEVQDLAGQSFDTVLAANMIAPQADAINFLKQCRCWTRRAIVWIVPSQRGPKKICLAGCLAPEWLEEEYETGYQRVMAQLTEKDYPSYKLIVDWTFSYIAKDLTKVANHLANRLGWSVDDSRREAMYEHLSQQAIKHELGYLLKEPKQSSILIWINE